MPELMTDIRASIALIESRCPCMLYGDAMRRELKIILASLEAIEAERIGMNDD